MFVGSITSEVTARFAMKSEMGYHDPPGLPDRHMPPDTLPIHMVLGIVGWMRIALIRPPIFPGPSHSQFHNPASCALCTLFLPVLPAWRIRISSACFFALIRAVGGGSPAQPKKKKNGKA